MFYLTLNSNAMAFSGSRFVIAKVRAISGGTLEIHTDKPDGPLITRMSFGPKNGWGIEKSKLFKSMSGIYELFFVTADSYQTEIDWISFK